MGIFILKERKKRQLSQKQLAELIHVTTTTVCKWEKGVNTPDIANLEKLAELFHVSIQDILCGGSLTDENTETESEPASPTNHPDPLPKSPMPIKPSTPVVQKRHWKIGGAVLLIFLMAISMVLISNCYMSQPEFSVIREFCPESGDLGKYDEFYNKKDIYCIIIEYSGNAEEGDFEHYSSIIYNKYYKYFDRYKIIAIAYFDKYDPKKDTFDTSDYQALYFDTQNYD